MSSAPNAGTARLVEHVTCLACGCLCDDVTVRVEDGRITRADRACAPGERWFLADRPAPEGDGAWIDGRAAMRDEAIARACQLLKEARRPLVLGLSRCATETVAAALALADRIGAGVDADVSGARAARLRAFQRVGRVSATLGEVKGRADVLVFWHADPVVTHPRHFERYSLHALGRFASERRTLIVADAKCTITAEHADVFLKVPPERRFDALWILRAIVRGVALDPSRVIRSAGVELAELEALGNRLKSARYGAWFHDPTMADTGEMEAMLSLVRDLNRHTRFVILGLGGPGNPTGAESATSWQTGFAGRVEFGLGYPRSWPDDTGAAAILDRGEADVALIVGDDAEAGLSTTARARLESMSSIRIGAGGPATVAFAAAAPGIESSGTVTRTDGVVLPLHPALEPCCPTDREWLLMLLERLVAEAGP